MQKVTAVLAILTSLAIIFANAKNITRHAKVLAGGDDAKT